MYFLQHWNRLSSMQRSIICMMVIFGTLSGVYIIPTIYQDFLNLEHPAGSRGSSLGGDASVPQLGDTVDGFARNAISDIHHKAKELKNSSSVVSIFSRYCNLSVLSVCLSVCLSLHLSVCLWCCALWLNDTSSNKGLNKWIGSAATKHNFTTFNHLHWPVPTNSPHPIFVTERELWGLLQLLLHSSCSL